MKKTILPFPDNFKIKIRDAKLNTYNAINFFEDQKVFFSFLYSIKKLNDSVKSNQNIDVIFDNLVESIKLIYLIPYRSIISLSGKKIPFVKIGLMGRKYNAMSDTNDLINDNQEDIINFCNILLNYGNDFIKLFYQFTQKYSLEKEIDSLIDDSWTDDKKEFCRFLNENKNNINKVMEVISFQTNDRIYTNNIIHMMDRIAWETIREELISYRNALTSGFDFNQDTIDLETQISNKNEYQLSKIIRKNFLIQTRLSELVNKKIIVMWNDEDKNNVFQYGKFRRIRNIIVHSMDAINGMNELENMLIENQNLLLSMMILNVNIINAALDYMDNKDIRFLSYEVNIEEFNLCSRLSEELALEFERNYAEQSSDVNRGVVLNLFSNFNKMIEIFCSAVRGNADQLEQEWILECLGEFVGFMLGKNKKEGPLRFFDARSNLGKLEELQLDNRTNLLVNILFKINHHRNNASHSHDYSNFNALREELLANASTIEDITEELAFESDAFVVDSNRRVSR